MTCGAIQLLCRNHVIDSLARLRGLSAKSYPLTNRMQVFIARVLLLLTLAGGFTPILEALSGVQPHACCLRRLHATGDQRSQFSASMTRGGNCCPPLTTPQSPLTVPPESATPVRVAAGTDLRHGFLMPPRLASVGFSDRAPPHSTRITSATAS
jgi:hypothetical protein